MSRSTKKNPFTGITTALSEKQDKREANRKERRINREILDQTKDETKLKATREVSNVWSFGKDGKQRIDPKENPRALRK
jgi:hypothetical protein